MFVQCKTKLKLSNYPLSRYAKFSKKLTFLLLDAHSTCTYHWIRNASFFEDFTYALNRSFDGNKNDFIIFLVEPRRRKKKTKKTRRA